MKSRTAIALLGAMIVQLQGTGGSARTLQVSDPPSRCLAVRETDLSHLPDAPTEIVEANRYEGDGDLPTYCQVSGYVAPGVGFVLRLPETQWNGKFIELGCGGFCGSTRHVQQCTDPQRRGYACIVSDNGHQSSSSQALWAYNNLQAASDHGYRAAHVVALAGKAIAERYYGRAPQKSYFMGGSTGGRQAMMEAQRFPWDFDGIIAGAPSLSVTGIHMNLLWGNRAITGTGGTSLLSRADLDALHDAVVAKCDLNDGVRDGLIGDPRRCTFEPEALRCTPTRTAHCLNDLQIEAVRKIYGGPVTSAGEPIYMPGALKGSERTWLDWFVGSGSRSIYDFVGEEFRYSAFQPNPGPDWRPENFDFDRDYKRFGMAEILSAAVNPDLRQFKATGGKLLVYAGWSDAGGMVLHTIDYYETAERTLGGRAATQDFFRLFIVPGMGHGPDAANGAFAIDWLGALEAWVEKGQAPDALISHHIRSNDLNLETPAGFAELVRRMEFPLDGAAIEYSRPIYPYPKTARYLGRGDPKNAANFGVAEPRQAASAAEMRAPGSATRRSTVPSSCCVNRAAALAETRSVR